MDRQDDLAAASELALTGRYREARDCLKTMLQANLSRIDALILLGKVEFYLRHPAASRACFETALSYEPGNMAAFFGLQFYRQRRRQLVLMGCVAVLLGALAGATAVLGQRLSTATRELQAKLDASLEERLSASAQALSGSIEGIRQVVEELRDTSQVQQDGAAKALTDMRAELQKLRQGNAALVREVGELRKAVSPGNRQLPAPSGP
jgi:tetratricopeptide (TPR) repeat protein